MWKYVQTTGELFQDSQYVDTGYSGSGSAKNDPTRECEKNTGPIPRGWYTIGSEIGKPTPVTLQLTADDPNYCNPPRSGFLIHGDNSSGTASTGCIVVKRSTREKVRDGEDSRLQVVGASVLSVRRTKRIRTKRIRAKRIRAKKE